MCADTYIALRCSLGSQESHLPDLEELYHYSSSYRTIFLVKMLHFWPKVQHRSTLYDRPSLIGGLAEKGLPHQSFRSNFQGAKGFRRGRQRAQESKTAEWEKQIMILQNHL